MDRKRSRYIALRGLAAWTAAASLGVAPAGLSAADGAQPPAVPMQDRSTPPLARIAHEHEKSEAQKSQESAWSRQLRRDAHERMPTPVFVKLTGPQGSKFTFYAADGSPMPLDAPTMVGLRSRHRYVFKVANLPDDRARKFYGSIEVVRGPRLPKNLTGTDAPAPIHLTAQDMKSIMRGGMITKVVILEDPRVALPIAGKQDEPIVYDASTDQDLILQCKLYGRIMMIVRIGNREPAPDEIVGVTVPGSLMVLNNAGTEALQKKRKLTSASFRQTESESDVQTVSHKAGCDACAKAYSPPPSSRAPAPANCNPCAPGRIGFGAMSPNGCPSVQLGPGHWMESQLLQAAFEDLPDDEYVCDGGDRSPKVGYDRYGKMINLEGGDTVAAYVDRDGRRRIDESNVVCVYTPRYAELRLVQMVEGYDKSVGARNVREQLLTTHVEMRHQAVEREVVRSLEDATGRIRPSGYESSQWTGVFSEVRILEGLEQAVGHHVDKGSVRLGFMANLQQLFVARNVAFARVWSRSQFPIAMASGQGHGQVLGSEKNGEIRHVKVKPGKPSKIVLEKTVNVTEAKIGDVLTFAIKFTNDGDETLTNVAIVDNLPGRLEYVANSAVCSEDAVFTATDNELGSQTLRWEIRKPFKGHATGKVQFKARVK